MRREKKESVGDVYDVLYQSPEPSGRGQASLPSGRFSGLAIHPLPCDMGAVMGGTFHTLTGPRCVPHPSPTPCCGYVLGNHCTRTNGSRWGVGSVHRDQRESETGRKQAQPQRPERAEAVGAKVDLRATSCRPHIGHARARTDAMQTCYAVGPLPLGLDTCLVGSARPDVHLSMYRIDGWITDFRSMHTSMPQILRGRVIFFFVGWLDLDKTKAILIQGSGPISCPRPLSAARSARNLTSSQCRVRCRRVLFAMGGAT